MEKKIESILMRMSSTLNNGQLTLLQKTLTDVLVNQEMLLERKTNKQLLESFLSAKAIEGCSAQTTDYYALVVTKALEYLNKPLPCVTTDDLRGFLASYQEQRNSSAVTINNMRRVLSSFFSWLEDEGTLLKSPMRRIKPIKTPVKVKKVFSCEQVERMRESASCLRDLALVELLASTGIRVGELSRLNRSDFNLEKYECVVTGKGNKERTVYYDDRTRIHLIEYFEQRTDTHEAAFTCRNNKSRRLGKCGIEKAVKSIGINAGVEQAHPHKFRRTLATRAIGKGMPIEQVQHLLGHERIDTTLHYAMVDEANVKMSHRKFIC